MFRVSERFACRVVGQHRSTQRHATKGVDIEEAKLRRRLLEIAAEHIRWGRRMAHRVLRREGWTVNHKGCTASGGRKDCRGPRLASRSEPGQPMVLSGVIRLNIPIRSGLWTFSSTPPPMVGG